jgi:hypothetical protein
MGIIFFCFYAVEEKEPCDPDPCGPNSQHREVNGACVCSCQPGFIDSPPNCRPECVTNNECPLSKACVRKECKDPCIGTCGSNAQCKYECLNCFVICYFGIFSCACQISEIEFSE